MRGCLRVLTPLPIAEREDLQDHPVAARKDKCMAECKARRALNPGDYALFTRQCTSFMRDCPVECGVPAGAAVGPNPRPFFENLPGGAP
jgi:hypothetical protein